MLFTPANHKWNDPTPAKELSAKVAQTTLSSKERRARIEAAIEMCGFQTKAAFLRHTGLQPHHLSPKSTESVIKLAVALGVTTDFLLVRGGRDV